MAGWTYVASAAACAGAFYVIGRGERALDAPLWMYDPPVRYEILPFVLISLLLAATRIASAARTSIEVVAAGAWFGVAAAFGAWRPMFNTVTGMGAGAIDALAVLTGLAALSMFAVSASGLISERRRVSFYGAAQLFQSSGAGILSYYLLRASGMLYLSTRLVRDGGLSRLTYEVGLREWLFLAAGLCLVASGTCVAIGIGLDGRDARRRRTRG
jgi:hypothetical protein